MKESLAGVRIFLSGTSRGVGLAAARLLLENGASVLGFARDEARLKRAEEELSRISSGEFTALALDLTDAKAPEIVAQKVEELWGALDIAIHNAGVMLHHDGGLLAEPAGILERSLEVNLLSPFRISRALLPALKKGKHPRIINVGSGAGTHHGLTEPGIAAYRLSKWAVNGMTLLQARELAGSISVNAFDPGWIRTDLGGPHAPGTPEEAAHGLLKTLLLPPEVTGKFFKDGKEIPW